MPSKSVGGVPLHLLFGQARCSLMRASGGPLPSSPRPSSMLPPGERRRRPDHHLLCQARCPHESVGGYLYINSSAKLDAPSLKSVGGDLYIFSLPSSMLPHESVGGYLYINSSAKLDALRAWAATIRFPLPIPRQRKRRWGNAPVESGKSDPAGICSRMESAPVSK